MGVGGSLSLRLIGSIAGIKLLTMFLAAGIQLFAARALGPTQFGIYAGVVALATPLAAVSTLGFQQTVLRFGARAVACGNRGALQRVAKYAVTVAVFAGSLVAAVFVLLAPREAVAKGTFLWLFGGLLVPLGALNLVLASLLRALERPLAALLPEPLCRAAAMAFVLIAGVAVPFTPDAEHFLVATATGLVLTMVWSCRVAWAEMATVADRRSSRDADAGIFRATAYAFLLLAANAVATRSVTAVLACVLAPEQFGPYALAARFADLLAVPYWGVALITAPRYASLEVATRSESASTLLARSRLIGMVLSAGPVVATAVFAEHLLGLVGPSYTGAASVLQLFALKVFVLAAIGPSLAALTMLGGERSAALLMTLFGALGVAASGLAAARWGAVGGAIIQSTVEVAVAVACGRALSRHVKHQRPQEEFLEPTRRAQ
jgi:O-antigen/teichoic acid export membrane protein